MQSSHAPSAIEARFAGTRDLSQKEQAAFGTVSDEVIDALAQGNRAYFERFGYIFIVCATGKTAPEMLAWLRERLPHSPPDEIRIAAGEQAKITRLRLEKLLAS